MDTTKDHYIASNTGTLALMDAVSHLIQQLSPATQPALVSLSSLFSFVSVCHFRSKFTEFTRVLLSSYLQFFRIFIVVLIFILVN